MAAVVALPHLTGGMNRSVNHQQQHLDHLHLFTLVSLFLSTYLSQFSPPLPFRSGEGCLKNEGSHHAAASVEEHETAKRRKQGEEEEYERYRVG